MWGEGSAQADKCIRAEGSEDVAPTWVPGGCEGQCEMYMHIFAYKQRLSSRESTLGEGALEKRVRNPYGDFEL